MSNHTRRQLLKATGIAGAAGITGLAGCSGGGSGSGNGPTSIGAGIASASTTTGQASNAFQRVVKEQSPDTEPAGTIQWASQETGGDPASLRQYNQGNLRAMGAGNFVMASAMQDAPPFSENPVESVPHQAFKIVSIHLHIVAVDGSGIETSDDLIGKNFWALPPSWGLRQQAETVFENAGMWEDLEPNVVDADIGDVAGAVEEGRVDALIAYGSGFDSLPGWATEVDARADLHVVQPSDQLQQGIEQTRGTNYREIDVYGWNQDMGADTVGTFPSDFQFFFGSDISRDVGYELAKISHENVDAIQESQSAYADHSDPEAMASAYLDDFPVHPGVYDFLEEQDVDLADYERGSVEA
ncbi:TAXI family TRAP transporter solute-binding subunit [Halocalculus aciditolerans]|uniref:TAXI family TRAP transporter solute-binding subunit n=1 Tax=Halocalculus aciditolerans TaxID=1383812 RepID=UPI001E5033DD|nr:TAXI family TRAP transporter solute-binding subunit [Halocalculus aciditolerans]